MFGRPMDGRPTDERDPFMSRLRDAVKATDRVWSENKVALTATAIGYVLLKAIVVSQGDLSTALAVLRTVGVAGAIQGSLLSALGVVTAAMLAFTFGRLVWLSGRRLRLFIRRLLSRDSTPRGSRPRAPSWWAPFGFVLLAALLSCLVTPWPVAVAGLVLGVLLCLAVAARTAKPPRRFLRRVLVVAAAALAVLMGFQVTYAIWIPHEVVTYTDDTGTRQVEIVYVLDESGGWTTLLVHGDRTIITVPDSHITDRVVCHLDPSESNPLREPTVWDLSAGHRFLWLGPRIPPPNSKTCAQEQAHQQHLSPPG